MRFSYLVIATVFALGALPAVAEETADTASADTAAEQAAVVEMAIEDAAKPDAPAAETKEPHTVALGAVGVDEHGHAGRIHVVVDRDTLWDISNAYLGTPWVWPSVWQDNQAIENPHLIYPGDRVWISPYEMRKITDEEAEALLSGELMPAAMEDPDMVPDYGARGTFRFTEIETTGFVSAEDLVGAASIVDSTEHNRVWLSDHTNVIIGLGTHEVSAGQQFDIFRPGDAVRDLETNEIVGYATEQLGWLEVTEAHDETATGMIRLSRSEIKRGDHLLPRRRPNPNIQLTAKPNVEGHIVHMPSKRTQMSHNDIVYLNRGTSQGVSVGNPLEIYRPMGTGVDEAQQATKQLPDHVVAKLMVLDATEGTSVAIVTHARAELEVGDMFRGSDTIAP